MHQTCLDDESRPQTESETNLLGLHDYLFTLENLQTRFTAYQFSYNKLLLEMGRRRQYQEAAERIVRGMVAQLDAMTEGKCMCNGCFENDDVTQLSRGAPDAGDV